VAARDDFLSRDRQEAVLKFLKAPGWAYGAYSDPAPEASRYWYKHFAGYVRDGRETRTPAEIEAELEGNAPVIAEVWRRLRDEVLPGHALTRCYANAYSFGAEGGLHYDSDVETHFTVIYYPLLAWSPNFGGETVFFNQTGDEIIASVYPKPNRLIWFPGVIPHAARGLSRTCRDLRITLMFKTAGPV
jgi:SM-20-related protein